MPSLIPLCPSKTAGGQQSCPQQHRGEPEDMMFSAKGRLVTRTSYILGLVRNDWTPGILSQNKCPTRHTTNNPPAWCTGDDRRPRKRRARRGDALRSRPGSRTHHVLSPEWRANELLSAQTSQNGAGKYRHAWFFQVTERDLLVCHFGLKQVIVLKTSLPFRGAVRRSAPGQVSSVCPSKAT